jgi:hypothetical protein
MTALATADPGGLEPTTPPGQLVGALREVIDPDLGINIVDLGFVLDVALATGWQAGSPQVHWAGGPDCGENLGHVRVDGLLAGRSSDGHPVVAIADEMQASDTVDLDRRDRRAAPLRERELHPAFTYPAGGGPEVTVEVVPGIDRPGDRVQPYRPQAQLPLAAPAERAGDLVEPQELVAARGLTAQAVRQRGHDLAPPSPLEVILGVRPRESGVAH